MKKESYNNILYFVVCFSIFATIVLGLAFIGMTFNRLLNKPIFINFLAFIMLIAYITLTLIALSDLRNIVASNYDSPFIEDNVKGFNRIGVCLFVKAILDYVVDFINGDIKTLIIGTNFFEYGDIGITPSLLFNIILALVPFVIAGVLDKAIKIKEENDLTI